MNNVLNRALQCMHYQPCLIIRTTLPIVGMRVKTRTDRQGSCIARKDDQVLTLATENPTNNPFIITSIEDAAQEVYRELCVRERIYERWVRDGKMTRQQAMDRGQRMKTALGYLMTHPDMTPGFVPQDELQSTPMRF